MDKKTIILVVLFVLLIFAMAFARTTFNKPKQSYTDLKPHSSQSDTTEIYMGLTRESYLNEVSNNGYDKGAECVYGKLIDKYGIEETYKIDVRAIDSQDDYIDPRVLSAFNECTGADIDYRHL